MTPEQLAAYQHMMQHRLDGWRIILPRSIDKMRDK